MPSSSERDLRSGREDTADLQRYAAASGRTPAPAVMDFYRLRWDLDEIALYTACFRAPHGRTPDAELSWHGLCESLDVVVGV